MSVSSQTYKILVLRSFLRSLDFRINNRGDQKTHRFDLNLRDSSSPSTSFTLTRRGEQRRRTAASRRSQLRWDRQFAALAMQRDIISRAGCSAVGPTEMIPSRRAEDLAGRENEHAAADRANGDGRRRAFRESVGNRRNFLSPRPRIRRRCCGTFVRS